MTRDLTRGNPMKLILSFGVPLLFGYLFQQFYSVVDTAIVGKTLGGQALAAVGSTGSINFLVVGFCTGVCSGFTRRPAVWRGQRAGAAPVRGRGNLAERSVRRGSHRRHGPLLPGYPDGDGHPRRYL